MKIASARIYALNIPFVESFSHNLYERRCSDSVIVKLTTQCGVSGYGEGVPRSYVTGETQEQSVEYIRNALLPAILGADFGEVDLSRALTQIDGLLPAQDSRSAIVWNASKCAVELAMIDCLFRARNVSVNTVLPARLQEVTYSGVIARGPVSTIERLALRCRAFGLEHIKMKVSEYGDIERLALVRDIMGPSASIRLDANGAFDAGEAARFLSAAVQYDVESLEQPIPRGNPAELAALRSNSPVPIVADESIVTIRDAEALIEHKAVDYFNIRISKCGGLYDTLAIAELAESAGIGLQLGCQVGETAVLSAVGRHVAAHMKDLRFVEGSYGVHLLKEDISEEDVVLGPGGKSPVLTGAGFGITVREELVEKYAERTVQVGP